MIQSAAARCSLSAVEFSNRERVLVTDEYGKDMERCVLLLGTNIFINFHVRCERAEFLHCVFTTLPSEGRDCILVTDMEW